MGDGDKNGKITLEEFINIDRQRGGLISERPTTLAANRAPNISPDRKPVDIDTEPPPVPSGVQTGTGEKQKSKIDEWLESGSYNDAYIGALKKAAVAEQNVRQSAQNLAGIVQFDSKYRPTKVKVNGIWLKYDELVDIPESLQQQLDDHMAAVYAFEDAQEDVEIVKSLKGAFDDDKKGAGKVIDEDKEFREKVKFYADLAKDILLMQDRQVNTTFEGLKSTADLMKKIKDNKMLVPGQQVYIPPTPQQNMWYPLAKMAGLPMGIGGSNMTAETFSDPEKYAKQIGVPGYAKGTPVQNGKFGMMKRSKGRLSAFMNRANGGR